MGEQLPVHKLDKGEGVPVGKGGSFTDHMMNFPMSFNQFTCFTLFYIKWGLWKCGVSKAGERQGRAPGQAITHYGPPSLLTVAPMTRRLTKISVFCPPPPALGVSDPTVSR